MWNHFVLNKNTFHETRKSFFKKYIFPCIKKNKTITHKKAFHIHPIMLKLDESLHKLVDTGILFRLLLRTQQLLL